MATSDSRFFIIVLFTLNDLALPYAYLVQLSQLQWGSWNWSTTVSSTLLNETWVLFEDTDEENLWGNSLKQTIKRLFSTEQGYVSIVAWEWEMCLFIHGTCSQNIKFWRYSWISGEMERNLVGDKRNKLWNHNISSSNASVT